MKTFVLMLSGLLCLCGCGGGGGGGGGTVTPAVAVSITTPTGAQTVPVNCTLAITASVVNTTNSNSSVNGTMVFRDNGLAGGSGGKAEIGLINTTGNGSLTGSDYDDYAGTWETPTPSPITADYSVASNGRMTFRGQSSVFYRAAANTGYMLSGDVDVAIGQFKPQAAGPFATASLPATFYTGELEVLTKNIIKQ